MCLCTIGSNATIIWNHYTHQWSWSKRAACARIREIKHQEDDGKMRKKEEKRITTHKGKIEQATSQLNSPDRQMENGKKQKLNEKKKMKREFQHRTMRRSRSNNRDQDSVCSVQNYIFFFSFLFLFILRVSCVPCVCRAWSCECAFFACSILVWNQLYEEVLCAAKQLVGFSSSVMMVWQSIERPPIVFFFLLLFLRFCQCGYERH